MRMIAGSTGGSYVRMDDAAAVSRTVAALRGLQRAEGSTTRRVEPRDRFALFATVGALLLALDALLAAAGGGRAPALPAGIAAGGGGVRPSRRRAARAAVILLVLLAGSGFGIGDLERGNRLYRDGRYEEAVAAYQQVIASGRATPDVQYNLGTALLALGRYEEAQRHFETALQGVQPELRQRTFYNLGNRFLQEGRGEGDLQRQGALLDAAIEAYRSALRMTPGDPDAKWNLELALRDRDRNEQQQSMPQQQDPQSGGGDDQQQQERAEGQGSGSDASQGPSGSGADAGASMEQQPMSQAEADRILSAIEQDERELTREKLRRGQRTTPVLRDW
jgi:Ca-activated chloride channel homolog